MTDETKPDSVIFDLDGTLADIEHRVHHVRGQHKDYRAFHQNVDQDSPIHEIISLTHSIAEHNPSTRVIICSGRSSECFAETKKWLHDHDVHYDRLYMRPEGDTIPDRVLKQQMLDNILRFYNKPWLAVDDRDTIADVWRSNGIRTLVCSDWERGIKRSAPAGTTLCVMVGPSGAGKTTWIQNNLGDDFYRVSSDDMRKMITGDAADQSRNDDVFSACHKVSHDLLCHGVNVVFDATSIRDRDRRAVVENAPAGTLIQYIVVDRPLHEKMQDRDWRPEWLIDKHHNTMKSNIKNILRGDGFPNVIVVDRRKQ